MRKRANLVESSPIYQVGVFDPFNAIMQSFLLKYNRVEEGIC